MVIAVLVLAIFKLYTRVWSFAGYAELLASLEAAFVIEAIYVSYHLIFQITMPRSYYVFDGILLFFFLGGSRLSTRLFRQILKHRGNGDHLRAVMIVGAGAASSLLIHEIKYQDTGMKIVCLVDDNEQKKSKYISGIKIQGTRYDIPALATKYRVDEIIIAIPSASPSEMHEIINICSKTNARIRILPAYTRGSSRRKLSGEIRDINYEDLLGRNSIEIENDGLKSFVDGKTILVTGAGGSIGSELCRQIIIHKPEKLLMLDIGENGIHDVSVELLRHHPDADIVTLVASVRDENRMENIFEKYHPQIVYHAAAHKHVPLMEESPCEAVKNNCGGTLILTKCADKYKVEDFIMISTDKAVRPTNVMGATKRICEMIVQTMNRSSETRFVAVRFGNVLGSNGSVIPMFLKQIDEGGPVTVTHREVTRFFMTISEAVSLVLQAAIPNGGGELFILDMGQPVRIYDLACSLIKLKGFAPNQDIMIEFTGLRPGEKLYEELLMAEEGLAKTANDLIFVGKSIDIDTENFKSALADLITAAKENDPDIRSKIARICDTYKPPND
jgi:FlaA1/EpsC-like NDP-sugar epimerase